MGRRARSDSSVGFRKGISSRSTGMGVSFGTEGVWLELTCKLMQIVCDTLISLTAGSGMIWDRFFHKASIVAVFHSISTLFWQHVAPSTTRIDPHPSCSVVLFLVKVHAWGRGNMGANPRIKGAVSKCIPFSGWGCNLGPGTGYHDTMLDGLERTNP